MRLNRMLTICLLALCLLTFPAEEITPNSAADIITSSVAPPQKKYVLLITSYHRGYQWNDEIENGVRNVFQTSGQNIELYVEYLDEHRFPDKKQFSAVRDAIAIKRQSVRFELVIASDNAAFNFATLNRDSLFPGIPLVFCGYNNFRPAVIKSMTNITGINEEIDFAHNIELAVRINPGIKKLVFILSTFNVTTKNNADNIEKMLAAYRDRFEIIALKDLPDTEIERQLAALPGDAIVFLIGVSSDMRERSFLTPEEFSRRIARASVVPVYTNWNFYLNTGVLGGGIITGSDQGHFAANMALKILSGTPASKIPVIMKTPVSDIFDYSAMKRFGIAENSLPPGAVIINRPLTLWGQYKGAAIAAILVISILSALVVALILQNRRRRIAEKKAMESESRYRLLIEQAPEAIVVYDVDLGLFVDANASAEKLFGCSHTELLQAGPQRFCPPEQADQPGIDKSFPEYNKRALAGVDVQFERAIRSADGRDLFCDVYLVQLPSKQGHLVRASLIDVTGRKLAEEALKEAQEELIRKEKLSVLGRLAGVVGHEIRNPLGVMSNAVYFLKTVLPDADDTVKEYLDIIKQEIDNSLRIITDLLDFARTKMPQIVPVAVNTLVTQALGKCAIPENIAVQTDIPDTLPQVNADPFQMGQVLQNLIINAVQAMPNGGALTISARRGSGMEGLEAEPQTPNPEPDGDFIEITVADTGEGISPANMKKLFSPLFTTKTKGIGLGLVVCKNLTEANGGRIGVVSKLREGTTFTVTLSLEKRNEA